MFFKNATLFRVSPILLANLIALVEPTEGQEDAIPQSVLDTFLTEFALKPIGPLELATFGFVSPLGIDSTAMSLVVGDHVLITLAGEQKILPPSSVNAILQKRIEEFETQNGRRPGGKARKRMKEDLIHELLPKALTKPSRTSAILNIAQGYIAVDTSSRNVAENLISGLRSALGSFPAIPVNTEVAPRAVLTGWVAGEELPEGLVLGEECELKDAMEGGAVAKCSNQDLQGDEIAKHLESGKQVTKLALHLNDQISFILDEALTLRKIRLTDGALDSLADVEAEELTAELTARFALMAAELEQAFLMMVPAFSLSEVEA